MKLLKAKRLVAAASVVAAAGIVPVITATPASADQVDCVTFLKNRNYIIGAKVRAACNIKHLPVEQIPSAWPISSLSVSLRTTRTGLAGLPEC